MTTLNGIDISSYQLPVNDNFTGLAYMFAKATEGTLVDPDYSQHIARARAAGIYVGAYHYNYGPLSVALQVAKFLAVAGDVDLYALDVEGPNRFSHAQIVEFMTRMHAAGKKCGLYMSALAPFDRAAGQDWNWVADYRASTLAAGGPSIPWAFWQVSGTGVDHDRFNGDAAALANLVGGATAGTNQPGGDMQLAPITDYQPRLMDLPGGEAEFLEDCTTPSGRKTTGGVGLPTPFGCTRADGVKFRAYVVSYSAGVWAFRFATPTKVYDPPTAPATAGITQAQLDAAVAAARADATATAAAATKQKAIAAVSGI
jgi:hypothetical protein